MNPESRLPVFSKTPELVMFLTKGRSPEILMPKNSPKPDRHLLLGLIESVSLAVREKDTDTTEIIPNVSVRVKRGDVVKELASGVIVLRAVDGTFGAVGTDDHAVAKNILRDAVRYFTGTVRLDVP